MKMAGGSTLAIATLFFFFARASADEPVLRCYDCQHCEKTSSDDWRSVDCANATCAKRVVSGYTPSSVADRCMMYRPLSVYNRPTLEIAH